MLFSEKQTWLKYETSLMEYYRGYANVSLELYPGSGSEMRRFGKAFGFLDAKSELLSIVSGLGLLEPVTLELLDEIIDFFAKTGSDFRVDCSPYSDPKTISLLAGEGFVPQPPDVLLVMDLTGELPFPPAGEGITTEIVNRETLADAANTISSGFLEGKPATDEGIAMVKTSFCQDATTIFLNRWEGEPAGGGLLLRYSDEMAECCAGTTLPGFRNRGIQQALIAERAKEAKRIGCKYLFIGGVIGGPSHRNAERLGFTALHNRWVFKYSFDENKTV